MKVLSIIWKIVTGIVFVLFSIWMLQTTIRYHKTKHLYEPGSSKLNIWVDQLIGGLKENWF